MSEFPASEASQVKYTRHLRNYLLNRDFQLRFSMIIVGISAVLTGGLSYFVMHKAREASRVVEVRAMDPTDELGRQLAEQFASNDRALLMILVIFGVLLCIALLGFGIVLTHKVAGPLFKMGLYLDRIRDGRLTPITALRKGDQLTDFFEHFRAAHDALRQRTEHDIALIGRAIASVSDPAVKAELEAARSSKEGSLR
jgi:hypothetical protein